VASLVTESLSLFAPEANALAINVVLYSLSH
jgi:hypothetical protein